MSRLSRLFESRHADDGVYYVFIIIVHQFKHDVRQNNFRFPVVKILLLLPLYPSRAVLDCLLSTIVIIYNNYILGARCENF